MSSQSPSPTALRVAKLSQNSPQPFSLRPDAAQLVAIAAELGLDGLRKLSFVGQLAPAGQSDWKLTARLGATVVQPCVVTLEPVTTRIDTEVSRLFVSDFSDPEEPEAEMPEDDTTEALGTWIDPAAVMIEALSIAVPDYPRKEDAALGQLVYTEPGQAPMSDEDARPFAGLAGLKQQLENGEE